MANVQQDLRELRGIPLVGKGIASAVPGTNPMLALLHKERKGKLQVQPLDPIPREEHPPFVTRKRLPTGRRFSAPDGRYF